jgi:hypothetical protein
MDVALYMTVTQPEVTILCDKACAQKKIMRSIYSRKGFLPCRRSLFNLFSKIWDNVKRIVAD